MIFRQIGSDILRKKERGFTLAEMIISVAILSIASIYIIQILVTTKNLSNKSFELNKSVQISKNIIDLISAGQEISQNSKNELLSNMKKSQDIYTLNFDENFQIVDYTSLYKLNMKIQSEKELDNINIQIIRLKPYIMDKRTNIEISNISSTKMRSF